jgi:serine/threonine protein kinase
VREARQLGQYVLESRLGEGGMGIVYRASHAMLRRPTAVKVLLPERTSKQSLERFEREVRQTARLSHPNTVTIYDYGRTPEGLFYYAMELLDGADLEAVVGVGGPQGAPRVVHVLAAVAGALAEAHAHGLVHRDIKPANIMLCQQGGAADVPKVLDFGLVREVGADASLTAARALTGTPLYMSPESISNPDKVDGRSDLYALGAVGYFLLSGCHVFDGKTVLDVCSKHLLEAPVPPSERAGVVVPHELETLILACLAKAPAQRPESASALQRSLLALDVEPWSALEAETWWAKHRAALGDRRSSVPSPQGPRTLAIDLFARS